SLIAPLGATTPSPAFPQRKSGATRAARGAWGRSRPNAAQACFTGSSASSTATTSPPIDAVSTCHCGQLSDYDARDGRGGFSSPRTELPLDRREFSSEGCLPETRKNRRRRAMDRRGFLTRAGVVAGVAATFPAPAIAQGIRELKM